MVFCVSMGYGSLPLGRKGSHGESVYEDTCMNTESTQTAKHIYIHIQVKQQVGVGGVTQSAWRERGE